MQYSGDASREGARKVLEECLALTRGDVFAIFFDETTRAAAGLLIDTGRKLGLKLRVREVPISKQEAFASSKIGELSVEDQDAIEDARGILTCLSAHQRGTPYRAALVRFGTNIGKRLGHAPGLDLRVLANAVNIDYTSAIARCDDLALALALGETAVVETYEIDPNGRRRSHRLQIPLGGLTRLPISSTGIIPLGTWGNLPGGETFIAPIEELANGSFALNGSFSDHVLTPPDCIVLHFNKGRVSEIEGSGPSHEKFEQLLEKARGFDRINFDALAELGIGVNSGITELSGSALFDEKSAGTVHIAIGHSAGYGGKIESKIHEDLISRAPSIWIDAKPILRDGNDVLRASDWRENLDKIEPDDLSSDTHVLRSAIRAEITDRGLLQVRNEVAAGRQCVYTVGNGAASLVLAKVYGLLPFIPYSRAVSELRSEAGRLGISERHFLAALTVLKKHGLISDGRAGE